MFASRALAAGDRCYHPRNAPGLCGTCEVAPTVAPTERLDELGDHTSAGPSSHPRRIDAESIQAVFDPQEINEGLAFRQSIPLDLMGLLRAWARGFCPLNAIERSLSNLIDTRPSHPVQRTTAAITAQDATGMLEPGDILIDCTGSRSVLRDHLVPGAGADGANTLNVRLKYALVITFLYGQAYDCNEYCKYYKNIENAHYKFIPAVNRTYYDGSISHVTGIVNISAEDFERMPSRFDGQWLRSHFPTLPGRWTASSARSRREPTARSWGTWSHPDPARLVPGSQCDQSRVASDRAWRPPVHPRAGVPGRRFSDGLSVLSIHFAGLRVCDVPGGASRAT